MTLTQILQKIRNTFYTKKEIDSMGWGASLSDTISQKADKSDLANYLPKSGGPITGTSIYRNVDNDSLEISGGLGWNHGAMLALRGKDLPQADGEFSLIANDGNSFVALTGKTNTSLTWGGKNVDIIEEQGDGYIRYSNGIQICWGRCMGWTGDDLTQGNWVFPKSFSNVPSVFFQAEGNNRNLFDVAGGGVVTTTSSPYFSFRNKAGEFAPYGISCFAIGRWK